MSRERIVVVGCGSVGSRHAKLLALRTDVILEICDVNPKKIAATRELVGNAASHESFDDMLRTYPDMIVIATPPVLHAEQTIAALQSGVHVLCEKPMSDSVESAQQMATAAKQYGRVLDVGFVLHFHPGLRSIKDMIETKQLGNILHIHWHVGTYETLMRSESLYQEKTFGALLMDYAHQPDLLFWWLRKSPTSVRAVGYECGEMPLSADPNVVAMTLQYDSPVIATINLNFAQHPGNSHCEVVGDEGWIFFDMSTGKMRIGNRDDAAVEERVFPLDRDRLFQDEQQAFLDAVHGRRQPESPAKHAIQSMIVVEAAIRSLRP